MKKNIFQVDVLRCNNLYSICSCEISESQIIKTRNRELQNGVLNKLSIIFRFLKSGFRLEPFDVKLKINGEREINSIVSSLTFIENDRDIFVSNLVKEQFTLNDGKVSLLLISPLSVIEYLTFAIKSLQKSGKKLLPQAVSFIKSSKIEVSSRVPRKIVIDESVETTTPAIFEVETGALNLSLSKEFIESQKKFQGNEAKDSFQIENLPTEKEREKLLTKKVSFFTTASEERHQKLFSQIRSDSKTSIEFVNLMVLSSTLVTLGLFLGSASVIIGAMILAPLMAPIISLSMGFLRDSRELRVDASKTLTIGFLIALTLSFFLTLIIPLHSETSEILGRTQPNLLDFFVAFISGIAGAYAKGDENVAQNIAGVAIAVALVPPIAVAGIGIGWGESWIFFGAMLLFVANLFGIIFASSLTFILMGFSPIKVSKKGLILFSLLISMVIYPLYRSFEEDLELNSLREQFTTLDDNEKSFKIEVLDIKKIDRVYRVKLEIILQRDSNIEKT